MTSWKRDLVLYRCKLLENKPSMDNEMTFYCFIEVIAISVLFISLLNRSVPPLVFIVSEALRYRCLAYSSFIPIVEVVFSTIVYTS